MNVYHLVHEATKDWLKYNFDDKLYAIRRNLMVASSVAVAASFVSPPSSGIFEVNIGLVKGVLNRPEYLFYFIAITCVYYLIWFYIHCRYVASLNYRDIKHRFFFYLSAFRSKEVYEKIYEKDKTLIPKTPIFDPKGGGGPTSEWLSEVRFVKNIATDYADGLEILKKSGFSVGEYKDELIISYSYTPTLEDMQYLKIHLDLFWRAKWSGIFTTVLPIAYATVALLILSFKIYAVLQA